MRMDWRWLLLGVAFLMPAGIAAAQDRTSTRFTVPELKQTLEDLNFECKIGRSNDGKQEWVEVFSGPGKFVGRLETLEGGTTLSIGIIFPNQAGKVSLAAINNWNIAALHTRGVMVQIKNNTGVPVQVPRLEADLDCGAGITNRALDRFVRRFEDKTREFSAFLAKNAGQAGSVPPQPFPPPVEIINLTGTTWAGTENLPGFGKLVFEFHPNQVALMVDEKNKIKGNWTQSKETVKIVFKDVVYEGRMTGKSMTGRAEFTQGNQQGTTWNFQITLQGRVNAPEPIPEKPDARLDPEFRPVRS